MIAPNESDETRGRYRTLQRDLGAQRPLADRSVPAVFETVPDRSGLAMGRRIPVRRTPTNEARAGLPQTGMWVVVGTRSAIWVWPYRRADRSRRIGPGSCPKSTLPGRRRGRRQGNLEARSVLLE